MPTKLISSNTFHGTRRTSKSRMRFAERFVTSISSSLPVRRSGPVSTRNGRANNAQVLPIEPHARTLGDSAQVEQVRAPFPGRVETNRVACGAGEPLGLLIAALRPGDEGI